MNILSFKALVMKPIVIYCDEDAECFSGENTECYNGENAEPYVEVSEVAV